MGNQKFSDYRNEYPVFSYDSFEYREEMDKIKIIFNFTQSVKKNISYHPELSFPAFLLKNIEISKLETIFFNIGMIELISYYKACCSPIIQIKAGYLDHDAIQFWKEIYFNGLGEFIYRNKIRTDKNSLFELEIFSNKKFDPLNIPLNNKSLVPVGGGKDSAVTIELLKNYQNVIPFVINPRRATDDTIHQSGIQKQINFKRKIDPKLIEMNKKGFLNGHTPFSALLAITSTLAALITGSKHIVLSNENSASEGNTVYAGIEVNHQYSKSFSAEILLHDHIKKYIHPDLNYFSFLRPVHELKIAELFSRNKKHFRTFRSCNAGSKENKWCGKCPKCLFTYIILSPFINPKELISIFGKDLLNDESLEETLFELTGTKGIKPFECVGTHEEVNAALSKRIDQFPLELPALLKKYKAVLNNELDIHLDRFNYLLSAFNEENNLNLDFSTILRNEL